MSILNELRCPFCHSPFILDKKMDADNDELLNGLLRCDCSIFPVLEGILRLIKDQKNLALIDLMQKGNTEEALKQSLLGFSEIYDIKGYLDKIGFSGKAMNKVITALCKKIACLNYSKFRSPNLTYFESQSDIFLKNRFSFQTLWSVYPFFSLFGEGRDEIFLDMCCGQGHLSYIIYNCIKPKKMFCVDRSFSSLYIARRFFAYNAEFICLDANYALPFKDDYITFTLFSDAFVYINSRMSLISELRRILTSNGVLIVSHLRNSNAIDPSLKLNTKLNPQALFKCFDTYFKVNIFPEDEIINDFLKKNRLDLSIRYSEEVLNSSDPLIVVAAINPNVFRAYSDVSKPFLSNKDNLIINPIFTVIKNGNEIILKKQNIGESFRRLYPISDAYIPRNYVLCADSSKAVEAYYNKKNLSETELNLLEELMIKFIILSCPQNFISKRNAPQLAADVQRLSCLTNNE